MPLFAYHTDILDSQELSEGDRAFKGMRSRSQSTQLAEGIVQLSQNMRLGNLQASVRKGLSKKTDDLYFSTPIIIPFLIPAGPLTNGQAFAAYGAGIYSDPNNDNREYIVLASTEKATFWNETAGSVDVSFPITELIEDEDGADIVQANNKIYIYRGWEGDSNAVVSITRSGTTATVTTPANHGLFTNYKVRISGAVPAAYNGDFTITTSGTTHFTFQVAGSPATPATGTIQYRKLKRPLVWDGDFAVPFRIAPATMPNGDYGLWQANRMIQPYARNEVVLSDILNAEAFNLVTNQAKVAFGANDYTVGLHPYQENRLLVFLRKSIEEIHGINAVDLSASVKDEITREVGCCARRTIQTAGNKIIWLSDSGVYSMEIGQDLTLVGVGFPMSEPIADYFERVNTLAIDVACSVYHNNRYYIACPLDGSTRNNYLFVYNLINAEWESVDTFPAGIFADYLLVSTFEDQRRVYLVNREGAIFLTEEAEVDQTGVVGNPTANPIQAKLWTRAYLLNGSNSLKRFSKGVVHMEATAPGDTLTISGATRNPDGTATLKTVVAATADDRTEQFRVKKRGHSFSLRIETTAGRPIIRSVAVDGIDYGYSTRSR